MCVGPGATVETRTPSSPTCCRSPSATACSACFDAEYTVWNGTEVREAPEPMNTTVPFTIRSSGSSDRVISAGAMTLVANDSRQSLGVASSTVNRGAIAAQCTSTSTRPSGVASSRMISPAVSGSVRSANTGMTRDSSTAAEPARPAAEISGAVDATDSTTASSRSMSRPIARTRWSCDSSRTISAPIPLDPPVTTATGVEDLILLLEKSRTSAFRFEGVGREDPPDCVNGECGIPPLSRRRPARGA